MLPSFPAEHELLSFFEAEPHVLDPGVPWFYNTLGFVISSDGLELRCLMRPAQGVVEVQLRTTDQAVFDLEASGFVTGVYADQNGRETLLFTTHTGDRLTIRKHPRLYVVWQSKPD